MANQRKISHEEAEQVSRNLMRNTDEFFQFAQIKAVLRLLRDDEAIDKELLRYTDHVLSLQFNKILKSAVPGVERGKKRVGEILAITTDELLLTLKRGRYRAKFDKIDVPLEDLYYTEHPSEDGYTLSYSDGRDESNILWTRDDGEKQVYTVECPRCDLSKEARLVKRRGELDAIVCASCKCAVIERVIPSPV
jgi:hypothetical protein